MKRFVAVTLSAAIVLSAIVFGMAVAINAATDMNFNYTVKNGEAIITGYNLMSKSSITTPSKLGNYWVLGIATGAFKYSNISGIRIFACYVEKDAFTNCKYLSCIELYSGCRLEDGAIGYCPQLAEIYVEKADTRYSNDSFIVLYNKDKTAVVRAPAKLSASYTMPDTVQTIKYGAFQFCSELTTIEIPEGVTTIEDYAFANCENLCEVTIPKTVTSIGENAFGDGELTVHYDGTCEDWKKVTVADGNDALNKGIHAWDNGVETKVPTCGEEGTMSYACTLCDATKTEEIPKLETHSYDDGEVTTTATCKEMGVKTYTCTVCGGTKTTPIPKDHVYSVEYKEPTCIEGGEDIFTCTVCGYKRIVGGSVLGEHSYADGICTVCGRDDPNYIPPVEEPEPLGFFETIVKFFEDLFRILFWFLYL